jgi:hypothetical protein
MVTNQTSADISVAPNNLHKMVVKSGLKNQMVAELKGVQPGTLSRHKSGDIAISLSDAEDYAKILKCKTMEIFFANPPIPILAVANKWQEDSTKYCKDHGSIMLGGDNGKNPPLILSHMWTTGRSQKYANKAVYMHDYFADDMMAVYWDLKGLEDHKSSWLHGMISLMPRNPVVTSTVDARALGKYCCAMTYNNELLYGILYQSGRNTYSMESHYFGNYTNLKIKWASPGIVMIEQPEFHGVVWADLETDTLLKISNEAK